MALLQYVCLFAQTMRLQVLNVKMNAGEIKEKMYF